MSTSTTKYILALGGALAIHFTVAADGTKEAEIAAFAPEMINDPESTLAIFDSAEQASGEKDALCVKAAVAESFQHTAPFILNQLANLEVQGFEPALV